MTFKGAATTKGKQRRSLGGSGRYQILIFGKRLRDGMGFEPEN